MAYSIRLMYDGSNAVAKGMTISDAYIHIVGSTDEYSEASVRSRLAQYGYRHASDLMARGAQPVAITIDGHIVLDLGAETWVVDAPRSGGGVEHIRKPWKQVVEQIERNEPVSEIVGWDDDG
jgi:hypothetical protein